MVEMVKGAEGVVVYPGVDRWAGRCRTSGRVAGARRTRVLSGGPDEPANAAG